MILTTSDEILGALEKGNLSKDFAEQFRDMLQAVHEFEGKGQITLKIKAAAKGDMVTLKATLAVVKPEPERKSSTFFITGDGRLSLQHPDQIDIPFKRNRAATDVD